MLSVVLLAGGSSSRFKPLKEKNLYPFLGRNLVQRQLERFSNYKEVTEIVIIGNDENTPEIKLQAELINPNAKVLVQQGDGQAGAVSTALSVLATEGDILIVNMNDVFEETLSDQFFSLLGSLRETKENLLTGFNVESYFPGGYLALENNYVTKVIEKPGAGNEPSNYVRLVYDYFSSRKELADSLKNTRSDKDDVYEVALSNMMDSGQKFRMLSYEGIWKTIKFPWHVIGVMEYFLSTIKGQNIADDAVISKSTTISGDVIIESGVRIFDNAVIKGPVYIGKNVIVGNNALVRNSMIGDGCVVGFSSEVARSYFKSNVWLHMNYVGDSIIENNVSFGSTALTANFRLDEQNIKVNVKGEKIDTGMNKLGAIIGSDVRFGVGTKIMPGVKVGNNCLIGAGLNITEDVADGLFLSLKQEIVSKPNTFDIGGTNRDEIKSKLK